ncbi:FAD/NAD(P)-binding protein [Streptomyces sp. NBC_01235]|uniref:FAD/NAD(P)-binding protein n=1 Tax=Streptomyces sp. NBC_01235 TaxID=2903788 RepID=UPI002E163A9C
MRYDGHRIVVLGAGCTGMLAAIRLSHRTRRTGASVTLVNPEKPGGRRKNGPVA